jgi:hypothetical protein
MDLCLSRRDVVLGGSAAILAADFSPRASLNQSASELGSQNKVARLVYRASYASLLRRFYDPIGSGRAHGMARIRPTDGEGLSARTGLPIKDAPREGSWWQMAQLLRTIYETWRAHGDEEDKDRLLAQAAYIRKVYTFAELGGDGLNFSDGQTTINALDDGGWVALSLAIFHDVTGDGFWLDALRSAIPAILRRFADPFSTPVVLGETRDAATGRMMPFQYSPFGAMYDTGTDEGNGTASLEFPLALAALYLHEIDPVPMYLAYANAYAQIQIKYFKHPSGNYVSAIGLDPRNKNIFHRDNRFYFSYPQEGVSNLELGGTLANAILFTKLSKLTGDVTLIDEVRSISAAIVKKQGPSADPADWPSWNDPANDHTTWGFVSAASQISGVLLPMADGWTSGQWLPWFARECLPFVAGEASVACSNVLKSTSHSILSRFTHPDGCFPADWGGPLRRSATDGLIKGYASYQAHYDAGHAEYGAQQIMTSACSIAAALSGTMI